MLESEAMQGHLIFFCLAGSGNLLLACAVLLCRFVDGSEHVVLQPGTRSVCFRPWLKSRVVLVVPVGLPLLLSLSNMYESDLPHPLFELCEKTSLSLFRDATFVVDAQ
jgi:hypothetical protein